MTGPRRDPTRRNRNLGTPRAGHGRDNRLVIPQRWDQDRVFWQHVRHPVRVERVVARRRVVVLVEPTTRGFVHCCTPDDVLAMLDLLPVADLGDLRLVVLRQPSRTQTVLAPVWGRLAYFARLGTLTGPAVYLEAQQLGITVRYPRSLSVPARAELERLLADGHPAEATRRGTHLRMTLDACRSTQLYRTLPHEIGHQVDYLRSVEQPCAELRPDDPARNELDDRYWRKAPADKEAFAHRYAAEVAARLWSTGHLPYARLADPQVLRSQGLDPAWFGVQAAPA